MGRNSRLSDYLWYTSTSLKFLGLWPISREIPSVQQTRLREVANFSYFIIVTLGLILQVFQMLANCWMNYTNFESAAESIGPMMALITSFGKMCICRSHRKLLASLVGSLEKCLNGGGPSSVLNNLESYARVGSLACGSLLAVTWILVGYLGAPLAEPGRNLPFASWYPFDYDNSTILYAIAYSHEVVLTCLGCCTMSTEITFVWFVCHCCARLKHLRAQLETLKHEEDADGCQDEDYYPRNVEFKLSSLVKYHCDILREIDEINRAYTYIVIVLFCAAVIAICCACLQVTSDSTSSTSWTILFLVLAMYYAQQLLFYYLPGEILAGEAMAIAFAAYTSGWETFRLNKNRRIINLMIMRAHSPVKLLAGQLSPLRLENYAAFLTTTASYFTSIRAVASDA